MEEENLFFIIIVIITTIISLWLCSIIDNIILLVWFLSFVGAFLCIHNIQVPHPVKNRIFSFKAAITIQNVDRKMKTKKKMGCFVFKRVWLQ